MELVNHNLSVGDIISNGFKIGVKNAPSLILATILWILTIWIPYLNVGTTIGLITTVVAMSKGGTLSPVEIFDSKYRRYMGEFFLLMGLRQIGIFFGLIFLIFPGIVISIAWSQAVYLLTDKGLNPTEALKTSNDITYGHKWTIFFGIFFLVVLYQIIGFGVAFGLAQSGNQAVAAIWFVIIALLFIPVMFGSMAYIYSVLSKKLS